MQLIEEPLTEVAQDYWNAGLCALPAIRDEKRPAVGKWKQYQQRLPMPTEFAIGDWHDGICIICGKVSGNLEVIDFDDDGELQAAWLSSIPDELREKLVIESTPSGGSHVLYQCEDEVCGNLKLAQSKMDGKVQTLIETRGEGGLVLCAPTDGYVLQQGDIINLPILTEAERETLLRAAWQLNEHWPEPVDEVEQIVNEPVYEKSPSSKHVPLRTDRPGDDFNRRGDPREILRKHGWVLDKPGENERWRRPGKDKDYSATLKHGVFYVFSTNAHPFEPLKPYSPFGVYTMLEQGGDFSAAARALSAQGYGSDIAINPLEDHMGDVDISGILGQGRHEADDDMDDLSTRQKIIDPGPFPEDLLIVPGFVGDVVDYTLKVAHRYQPVLALAGAIMLQAVLAARKVRDERGNRTNLYVVGVGLSSAGKEKPREVNDSILDRADADLLGNEEVTSDAAVLTALDERPAILFQFDEFGRFLRTMGDPRHAPNLYGAITTFMRLYSNANRTYRGKGYADAKRNKSIVQPCACIYGTSTPGAMYDSLTKEGIEDGFVGRLLFFDALTRPPRRRRKMFDPPEHLIETARWWKQYSPTGGNIESVYPNPRVIENTDKANAIFDDLAERSDAQMSQDENYAPIWGRTEEKACRLALIYACSRCKEEPVIDADAARWACGVSEYTTRRTIFMASQWIAEGVFDAKQKKVLRVICDTGSISKGELCRRTQFLTPKDRTEILDNLTLAGLIRTKQVDTRGRSRTEYEAI